MDSALRLLLLLRRSSSLRVSDAATELRVARSTAHRLLAMLAYHDFVTQDPVTHHYIAGSALTDIGLAIVRDMDIRTSARPVMGALSRVTCETVHLMILRGSDVVFVDSVESASALRVGSRMGMVVPAHASAGGKVLLAHVAPDDLSALYPRAKLETLTGRTIKTRAALLREVAAVRRRGYAINVGETEAGVGAVAAAILDRHQRARASLAIAAPLARVGDIQLHRLAQAAIAAAQEIGEHLG